MSEVEDWLQDPLMENRGYRKLKNLDEKQYELWQIFHYATGLKLRGADFFCTKVIDTARTSEDVKVRWYLDAFFFELMSAYDTLLQELNIVYAYDLGFTPNQVRWNSNKFRGRLPDELLKYMRKEREKDWFCEVQWYRNTTTHHCHIPMSISQIWSGHDSLHSTYHVALYYQDKEGKSKNEEISICKDYLSNMVNYISSVWEMMAEEFE